MNNQRIINSRKTAVTIYICLLACMILGSFLDYPISLALYDESNLFGILFAAYGEYPATLGMIIAGVLMMRTHAANRFLDILKRIGCVLVILMGIFMACFAPTIYLSVNPIIIYLIGAAFSLVTILLTLKLTKNADAGTAAGIGLILFLVIFIEMIVINIIKVPWGRARMRLVAADPRAYFMPWWQVGDGLKQQLTALGVAAEEFKSFPSGHAGNASVILLLPLAADLIPSLKGKEKTLFLIAVIWVILVCLSRIIVGAHYLTDVTVAVAVAYTVILLVLKWKDKAHD